MIPILIPCLVLFTGLYFIWRGERKQGKVVKMELDECEEKIS